MDVYVLTENGVVLGVGTDVSVCVDIADRRGDRWSEWFPLLHEGQVRNRSVTEGGILRDVQKIVRVPLAGSRFPEIDQPAPHKLGIEAGLIETDEMRFSRNAHQELMCAVLSFCTPALRITGHVEHLVRMVLESRASIRTIGDEDPRYMQVGSGAAKAYVQQAIDSAHPGESPTVAEDVVIAGMLVVIDDSMPPDQIRIGSVLFRVGIAGEPITAGRAVRFDPDGKAYGITTRRD